MSKTISEGIPDSHILFGKQRIVTIRAVAETKFGKALVHVKVDRELEKFVVIVKSQVKEIYKKEFEEQWPMCKVLTVID